MTSRPLDGVRVLDLTRLLPGAYATLLLADLGADVVKLEDPRGGDPLRHLPPLAAGTSVYFTLLNRNKRSVTLDLRSPQAAAVLDALAARSDVLIESFRPGTARRLGVDAPTLRARHPKLICAAVTGFGQGGPYAERAAHDINYEALAGLLAPRPNEPPRVPDLLVGDISAAMHAATGILAALFQRERSGVGASVDVSIHEAALAWMLFPGARWLVAGGHADPRQLSLSGESACYNVYETADGQWLALGALETKFWVAFCDRIERPDLVPSHGAVGAEQARALGEVRGVMRTRTREEWLRRFGGVDACLTALNSVDEAVADPHVAARGVVSREEGTAHIAMRPVAVRAAAALGADTDAELQAAGIDAPERARLRAAAVI